MVSPRKQNLTTMTLPGNNLSTEVKHFIKEINKHIHQTAKREVILPVLSPEEIMIVT